RKTDRLSNRPRHGQPSRNPKRTNRPADRGSELVARMIPDVAPRMRSPGEAELFELLRTAPGTEDWIALHSLDLSEHVERISGEADFVVVVPGRGVLVLEVKA